MSNIYKHKLLILIIILAIIYIIPNILFLCVNNQKNDKYSFERKLIGQYTIFDLAKISNNIYSINVDSNIYYTNEMNINIYIDEYNDNSEYVLNIQNSERNFTKKISKNESTVVYNGLNNGKNEIVVLLKKDSNIVTEKKFSVYFVDNYKEQFLDSNSEYSIMVHYRHGKMEDYEKSGELLKRLGVKKVRADFFCDVDDSSYYDKWVKGIRDNNIKILAIIGGYPKIDKDKLINSKEEILEMDSHIKNILNKYDNINSIELYNELNLKSSYKGAYLTCDSIKYYAELLKLESKENKKVRVLPAGTSPKKVNNNNEVKPETFYENLNFNNTFDRLTEISFHIYDMNNINLLNKDINEQKNIILKYGGFTNHNITEYGDTIYNVSEGIQAEDLVKQTVTLDYNNIRIKSLYNLWTTNDWNSYEQFGLLRRDYTPRPAYYSMKNFYENTNGSEYIGQVKIADGLETHVYDKDGKPKIIVWATDEKKTKTINYSGFTAKDLYGHDIENTDGTLKITSSPIYLDNVSTKFYYEAISNSITSGYSEFNTKFANEISKVEGLSSKISSLSSYAATLSNMNTLNEDVANAKIKEHFDLGNMIINAYKNGKLDVEYIKLSSMLDYLNTIGNSYEDLITVSAKSRITDLTDITNEVNEAKVLAEDTANIDIVYPNKIYKFAQDLLDTSSYILGLEEENDIKTGLINSKAIHSKYLAEWSKEFSEIYIRDAYKDSIDNIKQQNEDFKNKNSNIYKNTNISNAYNDIINGLDNIMKNPEQTNIDTVDDIYNKQFILIYQIVNEYNEKKIDINVEQYKALINDLIDTSENYRKLYNLFYKNEDISTDDLAQKLNTVIERYNYNLDADLSDVTDLINKIKDIYNNSIDVDYSSDNYLNKLKVHKSCVIIANILENDIKTKADEESKNVKVKYNIKTPTNQDVTAEIRFPSDKCSIENNPNNEIYTFTENKIQEITIKIRGYKYGYYIQINNIDKIPPKITGVEDKGQYEGKVTPRVTDENLSETKLIKDEKVVEGYKANTSITQTGIYQLIARDKAGNETSVKFIILQKEEDKNKEEGNSKEEIKEEKYKIENNTVKNINGGTKLLRLKEKLEISEKYKVKRNDKELDDKDKISTGDILETASGAKYTLIVKGDVNKDGDVNIEDIIKLERHLLGYAELGNVEKLAADTNLDNEEIGIVDLVRMIILVLER